MRTGMRKMMFGYKIKAMCKGCVKECARRCLAIKQTSDS